MSLSKTDIEPIIQNIQNVDSDSFLNFLEKTPLDTYDLVFHGDDDDTTNTRVTDLNDFENFINNTKTSNGTYLAILDDNSNCIDNSFMIKPIVIFTKEQQESTNVVDAPVADVVDADDVVPGTVVAAIPTAVDAIPTAVDAPADDVVAAAAADDVDAPVDDVVDAAADDVVAAAADDVDAPVDDVVDAAADDVVDAPADADADPLLNIESDVFGNIPTLVKPDEIKSSETLSEKQPKLSRPKLSFGSEELSKAALDLNPVEEIPNPMKDAKNNFLKSINDNKTKLKSVEPIEKKVNTTMQDELNAMKNKLKPTNTNPKKKYVSNKELQDALDKRNETINPPDEDSDDEDDPDNTWSTTGVGGKKHKKHKRKTQKNKKKLSKKKKQNNKKKTNKKKKTKSKK
jgi:hypothetical protein